MKSISSLNFGFTDAVNYSKKENKELFNRFFVKSPQLDEVLKECIYFLIGEKGTGKTAFAVFLSNNQYRDTCSTINFIGETEYEKFITLKKERHLTLSDYTSIWKVILLLLMSKHLQRGEDSYSLFRNNKEYENLNSAISEFYNNAFAPELINALRFVESSESAVEVCAKYINADHKGVSTQELTRSSFQINLLYIEQAFQKSIKKLRLRNNHILFIDGIDIRPRGIDYESYLECIKGLAQATWGLNNAFFGNIKDSKGRLKVVLLLRPDIFTHLGLQNQNNKLNDNSVLLDWKTTYPSYRTSLLFQLIDRILSVQQENECEIGESWDYYFPFTNQDPDGDRESFISFLRFSMSRPRDIISQMQMVREYALQRRPTASFITAEDFNNPEFRQSYSQYMLGEIKDYLAFYHTDEDYSLFLKFFEYLHGKAKFTYEEFLVAYDEFADYIENNEKISVPPFFANNRDFLQFLYDMDVICYSEEVVGGESYMHWSYRERNYSNVYPSVKEGKVYSIHYGLRKMFNTGRPHITRTIKQKK